MPGRSTPMIRRSFSSANSLASIGTCRLAPGVPCIQMMALPRGTPNSAKESRRSVPHGDGALQPGAVDLAHGADCGTRRNDLGRLGIGNPMRVSRTPRVARSSVAGRC